MRRNKHYDVNNKTSISYLVPTVKHLAQQAPNDSAMRHLRLGVTARRCCSTTMKDYLIVLRGCQQE